MAFYLIAVSFSFFSSFFFFFSFEDSFPPKNFVSVLEQNLNVVRGILHLKGLPDWAYLIQLTFKIYFAAVKKNVGLFTRDFWDDWKQRLLKTPLVAYSAIKGCSCLGREGF